jgi:protease I
MAILSRLRVAILATDGFEEIELTEPLRVLRAEGAHVDVIAPHEGTIQAFHHHDKTIEVPVDRVLGETVHPNQYDALMLPGGALNADALRTNHRVCDFVAAMDRAEKPIAAICHAPWILISAGVAAGRKLTSFHAIQDDLRNAGAHWVDAEVTVDDNLVTSRQPMDIPAFVREMVDLFSKAPALISAGTRHLFARSRIA